jgi:DNA-binding PadR family transcriptional regulator
MLSIKQTHENQITSNESTGLVKQLVDIEILYLLTFSPKSGYELKKQLLNWFKINVSYGTLYPHLHSLEKTGFITGKWHQKFESAPLKKRVYSLTEPGNQILRGSIESLTKIALTMQFMMTRVNMRAQVSSALEYRDALSLLENYFVQHEFKVRKSSVLNGFSGVEYMVDLFANGSDSKNENVLVRIVDKAPVTIDDILKTHVMSFDLEATHSIILSGSMVPEETAKLAEFYHISIFGGRDLNGAASLLCASYKL